MVGMTTESRLEIRDVHLDFGEIRALRGVDIDVPVPRHYSLDRTQRGGKDGPPEQR